MLARVDVELGPCELCQKPAAWHTTDGHCDVDRRARRLYRGRRAQAFVDLDQQTAAPGWETFALFANNAAAQVGL